MKPNSNQKKIIEEIVLDELRKSFEVQPALDPKDIVGDGKAFPPWMLVVHFLKIFNNGNGVIDVTIPIKNDVCGRLDKFERTDSQFAPEMQDVVDKLRGE